MSTNKKNPQNLTLWGLHYGNVKLGGSTKTFIYDCMGIATYIFNLTRQDLSYRFPRLLAIHHRIGGQYLVPRTVFLVFSSFLQQQVLGLEISQLS